MANCGGAMEPIGLTYKTEGGQKVGELSIVNRCQVCQATSSNRLAGDDAPQAVLAVYRQSLTRPAPTGLKLLASADEREIISQLFGRPYAEKYFASPR